ncbi:MAG TPA: sulfatase [Terriglobales bacterium]|nr:sulfatase [Terriglobales bacterium]
MKSLLLITVDCLRADHVGFQGYDRGTTPFLDSLAPTSFVLPRAIVAGAPTYFSFPAIMASRYPLGLGREVLGIAPQEPTLATSLQTSGYATAAFVAGNPYLCSRFGYHQGFTTFRDYLNTPLPNNTEPSERGHFTRMNQALQRALRNHRSASAAYDELYFRYCQWRVSRGAMSMDRLRRYPAADVVVDRARSWLSGLRGEPFFLWLHLMDPHHPYFPPEQALSEFGREDIGASRAAFLNALWSREEPSRKRLLAHRKEIISLYDAGIYWADKQIARLVTALKHLRRWDETVLAVIADHGEELLESDARYHSPTNLSERLIHVPLLIRVPHTSAVRQPDAPFSLIHLAPTLLDMLKVQAPASFRGRSCWTQIQHGQFAGSPAIVECVYGCENAFPPANRLGPRLMAVRDSRYKLVINFGEHKERVFDLANDPEESMPLEENASKPERARLLRVVLQHLSSANCDPELRLGARMRDIEQLAVGINHAGEVAVPTAL